jgi:hypothetical protein
MKRCWKCSTGVMQMPKIWLLKKGASLIDASAEGFSDNVHFDPEGRGSEAVFQFIADDIKEILLSTAGSQKAFQPPT